MHSPLVQKRLDRLNQIAQMTEPENLHLLKEEGKAVLIMNEIRRLQMELLQFQSTTEVMLTSPRLKPEIVEMFDTVKKRISEATGEPFFEVRGQKKQ